MIIFTSQLLLPMIDNYNRKIVVWKNDHNNSRAVFHFYLRDRIFNLWPNREHAFFFLLSDALSEKNKS